MSDDDFLSDVGSAIDNGGTVATEAPVVDPSTQARTTQPQPVKPNERSEREVADELSSMFEKNDPFAEEEKKVAKPEEQTNKVQTEQERQQQQNRGSRQQRRGQERLLDTFLNEDASGNLVNSDGEIIATAGKSREWYEGLKNEGRKQRQAANQMAMQVAQLSQKFKELYDEYKGIKEGAVHTPLQSIVSETGATEQEAQTAIRLLQTYKRDPIEAIKSLLIQAKTNGIDVSKIGANVSADPATIRDTVSQLLDERLKPLSQRAEQENAQEAANREASEFLQQYPEAARFTQAIATAKNKFPQMSLGEIWLRLKSELERSSSTRKRSVTKHRNGPAPRTRPAKPAQAAPSRNFETMSFDQIAETIIKDFS